MVKRKSESLFFCHTTYIPILVKIGARKKNAVEDFWFSLKQAYGRPYFSYGPKCNSIYARIVKPYEILNVNNAPTKSACYIQDTISNIFLQNVYHPQICSYFHESPVDVSVLCLLLLLLLLSSSSSSSSSSLSSSSDSKQKFTRRNVLMKLPRYKILWKFSYRFSSWNLWTEKHIQTIV